MSFCLFVCTSLSNCLHSIFIIAFWQYPAWLEEKRGHVADAEYEKREKQYRIVSEVCKEFEAEEDGETQEVKHARFERVLNLMQTVRR